MVVYVIVCMLVSSIPAPSAAPASNKVLTHNLFMSARQSSYNKIASQQYSKSIQTSIGGLIYSYKVDQHPVDQAQWYNMPCTGD